MLHRIELIQGIGLLHDANGKPHKCEKATLVYADNGRGKSTMASVLRSAAKGDPAVMNDFKTIDGTLPPKAILQFDNGYKVIFENGNWSEQRKEIHVFDADFVEHNVHSGGVVNTGHRKSLLEFALGESAVNARKDLDDATQLAKQNAEKVQNLVSQLAGYHVGMILKDFEELPLLENIESRMAELRRRISDAESVEAIQRRSVPQAVTEPSFDVDGLFSTLALTIANVHTNAEKTVREHVARLNQEGAERWLNEGQRFDDGSQCPYCDQDTSGSDLIKAYQTHFNDAYNYLRDTVSVFQRNVENVTAQSVITGLGQNVGAAAINAEGWMDRVQTEPIKFDEAAASTALDALREIASELVRRKTANLAESAGTPKQKVACATHWQTVLSTVNVANMQIEAAARRIEDYKLRLINESLPALQGELARTETSKRRHDPTVVKLIGDLQLARVAEQNANKSKQAAKNVLDKLMTETLTKYESTLNKILSKFGAAFKIEDFGGNFRGKGPRSEYGIRLRGRSVPLEGGPPSFATALSEGDKRTLAFAFFIAFTLDISDLNSRVVVIDDPMCSLDVNRKQSTKTYLREIHQKSQQLIILAHDPYFLRDLRDALLKRDKTAAISSFKLKAVQNEYTSFDDFDLDIECESSYAKHHRLLCEFEAGNGGDPDEAAKAIRLLLEGYLHRRFPGLLPKKLLFGEAVIQIRDAVPPSPLRHAANLVGELNEINEYAGQFHHDVDPDADLPKANASELMPFVRRSLYVVHKGEPLV